MKILFFILLIFSLSAAAQNAATYAQQSKALAEAGQITWVQRSAELKRRVFSENERTSLLEEYWAYHAVLAEELDAKRISFAQSEYMLIQKRNQINQAFIQDAARLLGTIPQRQPAPIYTPPPPPPRTVTNCYSDPWGNMSCVTQ